MASSSTVARDVASEAGKTPLWLWPNILSLDAPLIATLWQNVFAHAAGVSLSTASRVALPLAVWLIYLTDRLLDTASGKSAMLTARHRFYRAHRDVCYLLLAISGSLLAVTIFFLPVIVFKSGLTLAGAVGIYLLLVHRLTGHWRSLLPKEAVVGLVFAAGTVLAPFARATAAKQLLIPTLLFAVLCWTNSSAIEIWENGRADALSTWAVRHMKAVNLAVLLVCMPLIFLAASPHVFLALSVAAVGLWGMADRHAEFNADALRVWIDVPLLAPVLLLGWA